ncbi:hypothetical protein GA0074692_1762 [Micromonospora pallida]|uniref:Uncharacterized protein n=1 Tax=Micromonospora pallida TaxID=145854 RepID=A0A1C6S4W6_9ACTN|nr:hypothetical protein [Micromonospora pallida]SCL24417.1 hypothetical protein GA0074692_1762 [Micromonospora pallida]
MRFRRSRRPGGPTAERLLDLSASGRAGDTDDPVARLLAAAAAPARTGELAGEEAALAAFRAARAERPVPALTPSRPRHTARAVAWLAGLAVVATAGVAVATVGLDRSDPPPPPAPTTSSPDPWSPGGGDPSAPGTVPTPSTTTGATPATTPPRSAGPRTPGEEAQQGLCRAYLAKPTGQRGKALESTAFQRLVEAAGGAEQVDAYCEDLVGTEPTGRPSSTGQPTTTPRTGPPTDHPSPSR